MTNYQAPQGYQFDPQTGLYYTQVLASDTLGNQSQVVTWFNAETGEYSQNVYPVAPQPVVQESPSQFAQQTQVRETEPWNLQQNTTVRGMQQDIPMLVQRKRPSPPPVSRSAVSAVAGGASGVTAGSAARASGGVQRQLRDPQAAAMRAQKRREVSEDIKNKGRVLGDKGRVAMNRAGEGLKGATAGIGAQMAENARMNAASEGLAYTAMDKDGNVVETGFFRNVFYNVKRFINNAPWWLLAAIVGGCLVIDSIRALIWGFDISNFLPLILLLLFPAIPCSVMHFKDMKNKYGVKFKETIPTIPLALCGMLSVFPAVCISFDLSLIALFEGPGPLGVILWYICISLSAAIMYLVVRRRFRKYNLPVFELRITIVLLAFISVLAGIAALWAILIVMIVALVLFLIPMLLEAGSTPSTSTSSYTESHTEGYDQWGNKVYDSRYDGDFDTWANS